MSPKVSIGIPVLNGEQFLRQVLDSLLSQKFTDYELIISDNGSTDATEQICREYAAKDKRIRYVRHPENIGGMANLRFLLENAIGEYFMWAADDDIRSPDFLDVTVKILDDQPNCVAATSPDRMEGESRNRLFELKGSMGERFFTFMRNKWVSHGICFSLARRSVATRFDMSNFDTLGGDWTYDLFLASQGDVCRAQSGLTVFSQAGLSNSDSRWCYFRKSIIHWLLPFLGFSKYAWCLSRPLPILQRFWMLLLLGTLNIGSAGAQIKHEIILAKRKLCRDLFGRCNSKL